MASFFNRPNYTASWLNQRIYPVGEPNFDQPASHTAAHSPTRPTPPLSTLASHQSERVLPDGRTLRFVDSGSIPPPAVEAPPPIYYPGQARQRSGTEESLAPGLTASTNTASTLHAQVHWAYHPTTPVQGRAWLRYIRVGELWRSLQAEKTEKLWEGWPREFGGRESAPGQATQREGDEEEGGEAGTTGGRRRTGSRSRSLSLSLSRQHTRADSGVGLTPHPTMSLEVQHPLYPLYKSRIAELNTVIGENLGATRAWLALLEMMNYVWIIALIVALGTGKGKQTGFLKGVEIALVLIILLNGTGVNAVRMRRYTLSRSLRQKQRDWSPLPTTLSTTNAQLMRNYLDGDVADHNGTGDVPSLMSKDRASLRWRLRETEGSYWLSYRPIVRVELVTPASATNPLAYLPVIDAGNANSTPTSAGLEEGGEGGRPGQGQVDGVGAPPGYDEASR
ncbi:hypothetical protein JCM11641_006383 [Rhodosporidiobolus odoratus]